MFSTDLAYVHDAGFGDFAERAAPEVLRILRRHGARPSSASGRPTRIVEFGCGSGTLARHLVDAGYDVLGIDISRAMIRLARANAPGARFRVGSLTTARIPRCRAVVAIGEVISYVPVKGAAAGVAQPLRAFFTRVHAALEPGGIFIFDFIESGKRRTYSGASRRGRDWVIAAQAALDPSGRILTRRMITIRKIGRRYRRSQEIHRVAIYRRRAVAKALAAAGFASHMARAYGRFRVMAGTVAVVAEHRT